MSARMTEAMFLRDVAEHQMRVLRDDGLYRHIRFQRPGTMIEHFDLITWPGYLCYSGDMGNFVFERLDDMFAFFRRSHKDNLFSIDFHYWAEKVEATDRCGLKKFSLDKFQARIREWVADHETETRPDDEDEDAVISHAAAFAELRSEVEDDVCGCDDNGVRAYDAASDFSHTGSAYRAYFGENACFEFTDFWEVDVEEYTHRFLWCCHALAWGIAKYDAAKAPAEEVPA